MPSSPLSRRSFLGTSVKAGAGLAALGLAGLATDGLTTGGVADAAGRRAAAGIKAPPAPASVQSFVSRPDLTPPGVSISQTTDVAAISGQPQYIFLAPRPKAGASQPIASQGLMICDLAGNLVWWRQAGTSDEDNPFNLRVQTYGGDPVLTWYLGSTGTGFGEHGTGYIADGTYTTKAKVTTDLYLGMDLHEFLITPQDTALVTSYEADTAAKLVYGHALEIDIADGTVLWDWSSEGNVPSSLSYVTTQDYFHINSIDLWPGSARNVLISSRNTWTAYLIDRSTKEIKWRLGGKENDFTMGSGTDFAFQHDVRPLANGSGISLFDNASQPSPEKQSWGKVFDVDQTSMAVSLSHEFNHPDGQLDSPSEGNNQLLPTGGHFVGWGSDPWFTLFGPSGSTVVPTALLDGRLPDDMTNYRSFMYDWTASPSASEMALVVHTDAGTGNFTAYLSWNGATEIDSWRINAGTSTNSTELATVKRQTKTSFETVIAFTKDGATEFQGVALAANGDVLGRTAVVKATS